MTTDSTNTLAPTDAGTMPVASNQGLDMHRALYLAEAALSDIGDADRVAGDDLAWCEMRAGKARRAAQKRAHYKRNSARINARAKAKRDSLKSAAATGESANPWLQLAHQDVRPLMARIRTSTEMLDA